MYCALTIERVLWKVLHPSTPYQPSSSTYINKEAILEYIKKCKTYDGGISIVPGLESHGGSYFTGLASLAILNKTSEVFNSTEIQRLLDWGCKRQIGGMQGRCNKVEDTCYSFWVGGGLHLLSKYHAKKETSSSASEGVSTLLKVDSLFDFIFSCHHQRFGGFAKVRGNNPDVLHTFYSLASLSMLKADNHVFEEVDVLFGCGKEVGEWVVNDEVSYEELLKGRSLSDE